MSRSSSRKLPNPSLIRPSISKLVADSLDEIRRESEKAILRKEEMEKTKENEAEKLEATKRQRERAALLKRKNTVAKRGLRIEPRQMDAAQFKMLEKQIQDELAVFEKNRELGNLALRFGPRALDAAEMRKMDKQIQDQIADIEKNLKHVEAWGIDFGGIRSRMGRQPGVPGTNGFMGTSRFDDGSGIKEFPGPGGFAQSRFGADPSTRINDSRSRPYLMKLPYHLRRVRGFDDRRPRIFDRSSARRPREKRGDHLAPVELDRAAKLVMR